MEKVERFQARLPRPVYREIKVVAQKHDISMNQLLYRMIRYCQNSSEFDRYLELWHPRNKEDGFYTYHPGTDDTIPVHVHRI